MKTDLAPVFRGFQIEGDFIEGFPYGSGHINDTYCVNYTGDDAREHRIILQRINNEVFRDVEKLMSNIEGVTNHLRDKIIKSGGDPGRETLNIFATIDGKCYLKTGEGSYWRAFAFIEGAKSYDRILNSEHFCSGGRAFGRFQELMSDYPSGRLYETIPDFHNTGKRFKALCDAVLDDPFGRAAQVSEEIAFAEKRGDETTILTDMIEKGELPLRVTHNDTKFNNIMIDDISGEGVCIIDLDTVMPGLSMYDFGDSIRFGASTAAEDERELSKVSLDLGMFEAFTRGYLGEARRFLTDREVDCLPLSAKMMTLECGMRFLTDYLNGDVYFKSERAGQNLDRARTQFRLVADMERKSGEMAEIVGRYR